MRGLAAALEPRTIGPSWNDSGSGPWFAPAGTPYVTEQTALNLSTVWACQTLIADAIATLPVDTYRKQGQDRVETKPPAWLEQPNVETDRIDFDIQRILSLLGWGNSYTLLIRQYGSSDPMAPVLERWNLDPNCVDVRRIDSDLAYFVQGERVPSENIQHIRGYVLPGCVYGMSVIQKARQSFGIAISTEEFGSSLFRNSIMPSGALEVPQLPAEVSTDVVSRLRDQVGEWYGGSRNAGKPLVLTGGTKWNQLTLNPVDAQFLEQRKLQIEEICRWHRTPPHKVMSITNNASQGGGQGLEQQNIEFAADTLRPLTTKLERADSKLLPRGQYERYNTDAYVRTDLAAQTAYFIAGRQNGWLSANDVRRLKDEPPIPNGDRYLEPLNMHEAGDDPAPPSSNQGTLDGSQ